MEAVEAVEAVSQGGEKVLLCQKVAFRSLEAQLAQKHREMQNDKE